MAYAAPFALVAALALSGCVQPGARARGVDEDETKKPRVTKDLESARELDQAGVHAFKTGHYADAIRLFRAAYRKGAPSSELWNIARCDERLDDGEAAAQAIEEYLAQRDLSPTERGDAERELRALSSRPSLLTITTVPSGAVVVVDGKQTVGPTPLTVEIAAGSHGISIHHDGFITENRPLTARFGRAVIVSLDLTRPTR
jgi:hypothetical protein